MKGQLYGKLDIVSTVLILTVDTQFYAKCNCNFALSKLLRFFIIRSNICKNISHISNNHLQNIAEFSSKTEIINRKTNRIVIK